MNILRRGGRNQDSPRRVVLAVLSDTHGGHKLGLMNPAVELYDWLPDGSVTTYTPELSGAQWVLWHLYEEHVKAVAEFADGDDIVVVHNGDPTWGDKYPYALVSASQVNQNEIATANFAPWFEFPNMKVFRMAMSTASHVFQENAADIQIANNLKRMYPDRNIKAVHHGLVNIAGVFVDFAHHGPFPGSRTWLEGNEVRYNLHDMMMREIMSQKTPPDLYVRSHYHKPIEESYTKFTNGHIYRSRMVLTPSYMQITDFARQVTKSSYKVTNGMVAFEIIDGALQWPPEWKIKTYDVRTKEDL